MRTGEDYIGSYAHWLRIKPAPPRRPYPVDLDKVMRSALDVETYLADVEELLAGGACCTCTDSGFDCPPCKKIALALESIAQAKADLVRFGAHSPEPELAT